VVGASFDQEEAAITVNFDDDSNDRSMSVPQQIWDSTLGRLWRLIYRKLVLPVLRTNDSPRSLAMGVIMGLWVSLTPTVGIQMTIVVILGTLMRANRIVAVAMTWISNPVTFVPMYYGYYKLGLWITGRQGITYSEIDELVRVNESRSSWDVIVEAFEVLGTPLWIGSLVIATLIAIPAYPFVLRAFERRSMQRGEVREKSNS